MADIQIVKYKHGKVSFEVLTKPGTVLKFRKGQIGSLDNVLVSDDVWTDHRKGTRASKDELIAAFKTDVAATITKLIVEKGDLELSAAERKEATDKKRAEIVNYIHKYYINPQTKSPHPVSRIENALDTLKVRVDPDAPVDKQVQEVLKRLPEVMPVRKSEMEAKITVPHKYLAQAQGAIKKHAQIKGETYNDVGAVFEVAFVPGAMDTLMQEVEKLTLGEAEIEVAGMGATATQDDAKTKGKPARGGKAKRGK
jgi:ribosome maturation protein SDO1